MRSDLPTFGWHDLLTQHAVHTDTDTRVWNEFTSWCREEIGWLLSFTCNRPILLSFIILLATHTHTDKSNNQINHKSFHKLNLIVCKTRYCRHSNRCTVIHFSDIGATQQDSALKRFIYLYTVLCTYSSPVNRFAGIPNRWIHLLLATIQIEFKLIHHLSSFNYCD